MGVVFFWGANSLGFLIIFCEWEAMKNVLDLFVEELESDSCVFHLFKYFVSVFSLHLLIEEKSKKIFI